MKLFLIQLEIVSLFHCIVSSGKIIKKKEKMEKLSFYIHKYALLNVIIKLNKKKIENTKKNK